MQLKVLLGGASLALLTRAVQAQTEPSPTITSLREVAASGTLAQWFEVARRGRRQCTVTLDGVSIFAGGCSFASSASTANVHFDNDKCWVDVGFTTKTQAWAKFGRLRCRGWRGGCEIVRGPSAIYSASATS